MQKTKKKLVLDRVTLRHLSGVAMGGVIGGISGSRCNPSETCYCHIESVASCDTTQYTAEACSLTC